MISVLNIQTPEGERSSFQYTLWNIKWHEDDHKGKRSWTVDWLEDMMSHGDENVGASHEDQMEPTGWKGDMIDVKYE
jgi:hypothetical protein